jgi:hypothetical protein
MKENPNLKVTLPNEADEDLLNELFNTNSTSK